MKEALRAYFTFSRAERTGALVLLVAAVALLRRGRRADYVWFAPFALCLCGYLAGNTTVEALQLPGLIGRVGVLLGGFVAVSLWWFCLAVFDWSFRPRGPEAPCWPWVWPGWSSPQLTGASWGRGSRIAACPGS